MSIIVQTPGIKFRSNMGHDEIEFRDSGGTLYSNDRFQIKLTFQRTAMIKLLHKDSSKEISILYSGKKDEGIHLLPAADQSFILDDNTGVEEFFLVWCNQCNLDSSELINHLENGTLKNLVRNNSGISMSALSFDHK
jgi:hypothetical protein